MFQTDEKYERKLKSLQLELMNLGALKDKLERQLLYEKLMTENATSQNFIN